MGRNSAAEKQGLGRFRGAAEMVKRLFTRRQEPEAKPLAASPAPAPAERPATQSRAPRREADIPLDVLAAAYTPNTSSKAGFCSDGADHQRDQEFAGGVADDRWNDEDHLRA